MTQGDEVQAVTGLTVGAQLRRAREARGMTIEGVGAAIRLSSRQVEAIEADAYAQLMNATYARGFIRNYAVLIGLDAATLLAQLDSQQVRAMPQLVQQADVGVEMPHQSSRRKWLLPLLALSVPVIAALALYVWFEFWQSAPVPVVQPEQETPAPSVDQPSPPVEIPLPPRSETLPSVPETGEPPAVPAQADASAAIGPAPGERRLSFTFTADSWVELRDSQGRVILSELNLGGTSRNIHAVFPVSLVIGNAKSVTLSVDGTPHDLTPSIKVDVARLRLE